MGRKQIEYNGLIYTRDEKTGYYLNSTTRKRLHRAVWENEKGEIPVGYEIHHIDKDKATTDVKKLVCLSVEEHRKIHAEEARNDEERKKNSLENLEKNARPAAIAWHKSEEGRKWHKEQYQKTKEKLHKRKKQKCDHCGKEYKAVNNGASRFCSNACKSAYRRATGKDLIERKCEYCGETFKTNKYKKTKTCGRVCANKLRARQNRKENGNA